MLDVTAFAAELVAIPSVSGDEGKVMDGFETAPMAYAPGTIHVAHTPHEHVEITELEGSVDAHERIVGTLLAS